jgi:hypothetical protein
VNPYSRLLAARRLLFYAPRGSTYTLNLSATVVSATATSLRIRVHTLRLSPTNLVLRRLSRLLTLSVPDYATIERGDAGQAATLASAKRGDRVAIWTEAATVTPEAQFGKAGWISAERILLAST